MSFASFAGQTGHHGSCGNQPTSTRPRRALEIVGVLGAFFYFWPLAVAYLVWKTMGYPMPTNLRDELQRGFSGASNGFEMFRNARWNAAPFTATTGNRAFDDYRRSEIERLNAERRRLDEEARGFGEFVEELKRAKDREEFDAYMAKRRAAGGPGAA